MLLSKHTRVPPP